jgi:glycosyltransferase involved in cell wall biosynthesis
MRSKQNGNVVMIGTPPDGRGGMSAVVAAYRDGGLFDHCGVIYVSTFAEGSRLRKLLAAFVALLRLIGILMIRHVSVVHIHLASDFSFWRKAILAIVAYGFRKPVILHLHGGNFVEFFSASPAVARRFMLWIFDHACKVVVLSAAWVDRLSGIVPAAKCVVIQNPVVPPAVGTPAREGRAVVTFLFLGRLERDKGVFELISAFAKVAEALPQVRLVVGGDGELAECERLAIALKVREKVEFPGWVTGEDKQRWLLEADVFVLPSHIEGLPISMLEAMSYRLPVVICPVGSIPETIHDQVEALFVPVADVDALASAMLELARDPGLRTLMGQRGQLTFAARYSIDSVIPRIEALYDEVGGRTAKKILAVASAGGHWVQLLRLRPAFEGHHVEYLSTNDGFRTDVNECLHVVTDASMWEKLKLLKMFLEVARVVFAMRPDVVVTTGAAPGFAAIVFGRLIGARTIWIDSIANAEKLSSSGRQARHWASAWLTQWKHLSSKNGPNYWGAVL